MSVDFMSHAAQVVGGTPSENSANRRRNKTALCPLAYDSFGSYTLVYPRRR